MSFHPLSRIALTSLLFVLLVVGCKNEPLKIGVVLPLSGEDAAYGQATQKGMDLALADLRSRGQAHDLVLEFHDSASNPATARARVEALFEDRVIAVVAGLSPAEAEAVAPLADELERVILSPAASDQRLSEANRHFFRLAPSAEMIGTTVATFARDTLDLDTLALVAESEDQAVAYGESLQATFERHGGTFAGRHVDASEELGELLRTVRADRPDAVLVAGWGDWLATAVDGLRDAGYRGKIFTPESFAVPNVLAAAGGDARGVMVARTAYETESGGDAMRRFVDAYRQQHDEDPGLYAAYAWDATRVLAAALEDRPHLPGEMRSWLRDLPEGDPGVTGHLQFDETGSAKKYPRIYSVADDLALRDHGRWLEDERARIAEERRKLQERLQQTRRELMAASG